MSVCFLIDRPNDRCGFNPIDFFRKSKSVLSLNGKVGNMRHEPVMVDAVLETLPLQPGSVVVDGTIGLGGHSLRFLERIQPGGTLIGLDWDESMLEEAKSRIGQPSGANVRLLHDSFSEVGQILGDLGAQANGIVLDLGLNSAQVDDRKRGMSFLGDGPLDMRMDRSRGEPASALLNRLNPTQISDLLGELGDERWAVAIAKKVVERRKQRPLKTSLDLVECVLAAIPERARDRRIHPATRTFQAVRIAVNRELEILEAALRGAANALAPEGVLVVISYHSGEDRIVKNTFRELARLGFEDIYKKPRLPSREETLRNSRSRSAKMRALKRVISLQR